MKTLRLIALVGLLALGGCATVQDCGTEFTRWGRVLDSRIARMWHGSDSEVDDAPR